MKKQGAFTLIELLVTISVIAILGSLLLSGLSNAMKLAKRVRCQSQMKQWGIGTLLYLDDWDNQLPDAMGRITPNVIDLRSGYPNATYQKLKLCPSARKGAPPFSNKPERFEELSALNCQIAEIYGENLSKEITAPFTLSSKKRDFVPVKADRFRRPSEAMIYMDGFTSVASPREHRWRFVRDMDSDSIADTSLNHFNIGVPFNSARPTVHNGGANAALLDGHVEWETYKKLWHLNPDRTLSHRFWGYK